VRRLAISLPVAWTRVWDPERIVHDDRFVLRLER
jgi:hypothetical protein